MLRTVESEVQSEASALVKPDWITPQYLPEPKSAPFNCMLLLPVLDPWFRDNVPDTTPTSNEHVWVLDDTKLPKVKPVHIQELIPGESLQITKVSEIQSVTKPADPPPLDFRVYLCNPKSNPVTDKVDPKNVGILRWLDVDVLILS